MADKKKASNMARRKQEIQLQQEIETQEEWEDIMSKEGLYVVDVYQEWCGPCTGLVANLKRLKNELGDDLLHFAIAKADTIDALEKYRGRCEPCFLFYAGGVLVAVIRGANSPMVMRTVTEQLQQEHKVIDGTAERKEIKDPYISMVDTMDDMDEDEEETEEGRPASKKDGKQMRFKGELVNFGDENDRSQEAKKEVTVAIIKPDAVQAGKVDEILAEIKTQGIEILKQEERVMTEEEATNMYTHLQEEEFFKDLITFMTSGPSHILVLTKGRTGENIINNFRDLLGPTSVEEAKEKQPESLRAKHGQETYMNALHGSSSEDQAMRELGFFFPDYVIPAAEGKPKLQRTLALIRPDAFKLHKEEVIQMINEAGFKIALQKEMLLTKEMAEDFYKEHKGQEYFDELVTRMSSGPLMALGLAREDAVEGWRGMLGPKELDKAKEEAPDSLRAKFAVDDVMINQFHGSDSEDSAQKELEFFFPVQQTMAVIKPDALGTKDEIIEKVHEAGFKIAARKETTLSMEIAKEFYSDHKDKDYYNDLVEHMASGPTMFMVLSREDAVDGWRSLIGPTDPEKAKEDSPESLRALYGGDILKNAVHGSSNTERAKDHIQKIFGDLKFTCDGWLVKDEQEMQEQDEKTEEAAGEETQQTTEGEEQKGEEKKEEGGEQTTEQQEEKQEGEEKKEEGTEGGDQTTEQQEEKQGESTKGDKPSKEQTGDLEEPPKQEQAEEQEQDTAVTKKSTEVEDVAPEDRQRFREAEAAKTEEEKPQEEEQKSTEEAKPSEEETPKEEEKAPEEPPKTEEEPKQEEAKTEEESPKEEEKSEEAPKEEEKKEEEKKEEEVKQEEEAPKPAEEEAKPEGEGEAKTEEPEQQKTEEQTKTEEPTPEETKTEGEDEKKEEETKTEGEGAA
ncbi:thioredoxin domain-containing protein 3 homolog isoform X4 [Pecten maximus]|uniref:thioredoxin domain-containing protein 3 homolog isoform X4 n=1 Tax=Pecten maximus TaxID=6579 RepID=UPI001458C948|nr:thioredoxin domain-containing protein 3 homolog isoform X4 [Pecten maximus]